MSNNKTKEQILEDNGFDFDAFKLENEYSAKNLLIAMDEYSEQKNESNAPHNAFIIKDKNGNPIKAGQRFRFKFMRELHERIELIGSFDWSDEELRYEIDVWDNDEYVCISYVSNGIMYDFELL